MLNNTTANTIETLFYVPKEYFPIIRSIHFYFESVVGISSYILNVTIIYLACYKSNRHMKNYSAVIIANACFDIVFNTAYWGAGTVSGFIRSAKKLYFEVFQNCFKLSRITLNIC